jgi:MarR-like DNA-binding transcriptional regulator SgrR of sgrS sRNA
VRLYLNGSLDTFNPRAPSTDLDFFLAGALSRTLTRIVDGSDPVRDLAGEWECATGSEEGSELAWTFRIDPGARFPDGSPVTPRDVVRSWLRAAATAGSPARWLLRPVAGFEAFVRGESEEIEGLDPGGDALTIRLSRPCPDVPLRLAHPALAIWREGESDEPVGPGAFALEAGSGRAGANGQHPRERHPLDGFEIVESGSANPAALVSLDEVDLAVIHGRDAAGLLAGTVRKRYRIERFPAWDRLYVLWLNPGAGMRWTRDPTFRSWIDSEVDRETMVDLLLDGLGKPAWDLHPGGGRERAEAEALWRIPRATRPRLTLSHDAADALAARLAARIKADLEGAGVEVSLDGLSESILRARLEEGSVHAALLCKRPFELDPLLSLENALGGLAPETGDLRRALEWAALHPPGTEERRRTAEEVRARLFHHSDSPGRLRLIPLVRVHAYLAAAKGLAGPRPASTGSLDLKDVGWVR